MAHGATEKEKYQVDIPQSDQWSYQAVAAVITANSFLRSLKMVDSTKIGVTGVSWGGYLTLLAAASDERFAFAIPVYGCGYYDGTYFKTAMLKRKRTEADIATWCKLWDPANYLANAKMPLLMVNGTDDFFFHPDAWVKTTHIPDNIYMAVRVHMKHSHTEADVPVVYSFARKAEYSYTADSVSSKKRKWTTVPVTFTPGSRITLTCHVPATACSGFFSVFTGEKYPETMGLAKNYGKLPVYSSSRPLYTITNNK